MTANTPSYKQINPSVGNWQTNMKKLCYAYKEYSVRRTSLPYRYQGKLIDQTGIKYKVLIMSPHRNRKNFHPQYLHQEITLTGLGIEAFDSCLDNINAAQRMFSREFQENSFIEWSPSTFREYQAVHLYNRYFVSRQEAPSARPQEFNTNTDPKGYLQSLASDQLIHTEDNRVDYYTYNQASGRQAFIYKSKTKRSLKSYSTFIE